MSWKKNKTKVESTEIVDTQNGAKKKKKGKKILVGVVIASVVVVFIASKAMKGEVTMPVNVQSALKGTITQTVDTSGMVESEEVKAYFANVNGKVANVTIENGGNVKKGESLLTYDLEELESAVKQAELETKASDYGIDVTVASLNEAQNKASQAAADYDEADQYVQHFTNCVNSINSKLSEANKIVSKIDELSTEIDGINGKLEAKPKSEKLKTSLKEKTKELEKKQKELKKYDINELNSSLAQFSEDLAYYKAEKEANKAMKESDPTIGKQREQQTVLKEVSALSREQAAANLEEAKAGVSADFSGIVTGVAVVPGQMVAAGSELFTIANDKKVKVVIEVSKYDLTKLEIGQKAKVTVNNKEYVGSVQKIERMAHKNESGAAMVYTDIRIENPDDNIYLGIEGKVSIETANEKDVLLVPVECINSDTDGEFCYIVEDNKIVRKNVATGISSNEYIQILDGLKEGEKVVTDVSTAIIEGLVVMPIEAGEQLEEPNENKKEEIQEEADES